MLERSCCREAGGITELFDKLPGVQSIEEVDITGAAVEHGDRQLRAVFHIDSGGFLIRIAAILEFEFFHVLIPQMFVENPDLAVHV